MGNRLLKVGSDENPFNTKLVKWLNALPFTEAHKLAGGRFTRGYPDIIGAFEGTPFYLEQKHFSMRETLREDTIIIGEGCSDERKRWSDFQRRWLEGMDCILGETIIGGLVGIQGYGRSTNPDLILGMTLDFVLGGHLTAGDVRLLWEHYPQKQMFLIGWPYEVFTYDIPQVQKDLPTLLREMRTVDSEWLSS